MNRRPRTNRPGFTLIEILVVAMVIVLLVTMLVPVLGKYKRVVKSKITQTTINQLDMACNKYQIDLRVYPPSSNPAYGTWSGAQILPLYLIGYADNPTHDGIPDSSGKLDTNDGVDGPGFRTTPKGVIYGPYGVAESLPIAGGNPRWFTDAFDQPIRYYRFGAVAGYNPNDNTGAFQGPSNVNSYAKDPNNSSSYLRKDFLLTSPGADGAFATQYIDGSDDITNLYPHSP
jgi:prepilin-type N-terminal cleavage/methylation domain-containing protein